MFSGRCKLKGDGNILNVALIELNGGRVGGR